MFYKTYLPSRLLAFSLLVFMIFLPRMGFTGGDNLLDIKKELSEIKKDLEEIKKILSGLRVDGGPSLPMEADVSIDDDPLLGKKDAPITLIVFSDYQCPFCARFSNETLPLLKKDYLDTGKLRYVFRDLPLGFHQFAQKAAEAANCAGEQGRYWEMHDMIFSNQQAMKIEDIKGYATQINLDLEAFTNCLEAGKYEKEIKKDIDDGAKAVVSGTPTFFLGITGKDQVIKGKRIVGAQPYDLFKQQIEELLKKASTNPKP